MTLPHTHTSTFSSKHNTNACTGQALRQEYSWDVLCKRVCMMHRRFMHVLSTFFPRIRLGWVCRGGDVCMTLLRLIRLSWRHRMSGIPPEYCMEGFIKEGLTDKINRGAEMIRRKASQRIYSFIGESYSRHQPNNELELQAGCVVEKTCKSTISHQNKNNRTKGIYIKQELLNKRV